MSEPQEIDKILPKSINAAQLSIISGRTPASMVKTRPGANGMQFKYVEVGYVVDTLNKAFGFDWNWEVVNEQIGRNQVWVKGRLTVKGSSGPIIKDSYGGQSIKLNRNGEVIDIADDLKAASADALKKAASYLGVAADIYWPQMDRIDVEKDSEGVVKTPTDDRGF